MKVEDTTAVLEHSAETPVSGGLFSIDPGMAIWTWVIFGLLFVILRKFAWKPMMDSVQAREKVLSQAVEQAEKTKQALDEIGVKQADMLRQTQEQARELIEKVRGNADLLGKRLDEKAAVEAQRLIVAAKEQIGQEKEQALREIKEQSVAIIIAATEKLLTKNLDVEMHRQFIEKQLEEL